MADKTIADITTGTSLASNDILHYQDLSAAVSTRDKKITKENFFKNVSKLGLEDDRITFHEITTTNISVAGWYTVAVLASGITINEASASVTVSESSGGRGLTCDAAFQTSINARNHKNTTLVKRMGHSYDLAGGGVVEEYRILKSDTSATAGAKLEVFLRPTSSRNIKTTLLGNTSFSGKGWEIQSLTFSSGNTPDGNPATALIAGEEQQYYGNLCADNNVSWLFVSSGQVRMTFKFDVIPYSTATTTALTYTQLTLKDSTNTYNFDGSETIGAPAVTGKTVAVVVTKVGGFTGFSNTANTVFHNNLKIKLS